MSDLSRIRLDEEEKRPRSGPQLGVILVVASDNYFSPPRCLSEGCY